MAYRLSGMKEYPKAKTSIKEAYRKKVEPITESKSRHIKEEPAEEYDEPSKEEIDPNEFVGEEE